MVKGIVGTSGRLTVNSDEGGLHVEATTKKIIKYIGFDKIKVGKRKETGSKEEAR